MIELAMVVFFLLGAVLGAGSGNWGVAILVAAVCSLGLAIVGRDTKIRILGSIFVQFGIFFVISEIIVLLAYMILEMDLLGKISQM